MSLKQTLKQAALALSAVGCLAAVAMPAQATLVTINGPAVNNVDTGAPTLVNLVVAQSGTIQDLNLFINFDPANMLLYDMGDPIAAIEMLAPHVRSVHLKDATSWRRVRSTRWSRPRWGSPGR